MILIDPTTGEIKESDVVQDGWIEFIVPTTNPESPIRKPVTKVYFVEKLISLGYASTLDAMLAQSPAEIKQAWYAYPTVNLSDPRLVAFFNTANIDLKEIFK